MNFEEKGEVIMMAFEKRRVKLYEWGGTQEQGQIQGC